MREKLRWLLLAGLAVAPVSATAQEHEFPTLNTIGRFLGVGYSHTGYHGRRDGRFDAIQARHPAGNYGSSALGYPYDPAYRPYRPVHTPPASAIPSQPYIAPETPSVAPELANEAPEEVKPAKPVGPPPQWLKPHIVKPETESREPEVRDRSPSDRVPARDEVYGELTPPRQPSSRAESPFYIEPDAVPGPSDVERRQSAGTTLEDDLLGDDLLDSSSGRDDLLDSGGSDLLLDEEPLDDDDLLLDDDDLSARRYMRRSQPRTATKPGERRKVSVLQSPIPTATQPDLQPAYQQPPTAGFVQYRQSQQQQYRSPSQPSHQAPPQNNYLPRFLGTPRPSSPQPARVATSPLPNSQMPGQVVSYQRSAPQTQYLQPPRYIPQTQYMPQQQPPVQMPPARYQPPARYRPPGVYR